MEHSKYEKFYTLIKSRGFNTPLDILPNLTSEIAWYLSTYKYFLRAKTELTPIPLSELINFAKNIDIVGTIEEFLDVMQEIDFIYIKYFKAVAEKENEKEEKRKASIKVKGKNK